MEIVNRKNEQITEDDLYKLYDIYENNLPGYVKTDVIFQSIVGDEYRSKWVNEIMEEPNKLVSMFYEGEALVGYIMIYEKEEENYIREFEIIKEYQDDGKTFRGMISLILPYTNKEKLYTGKILQYNDSAKVAFFTVGAIHNKGLYVCPYDRLVAMLEIDPSELKYKYNIKKKKKKETSTELVEVIE
jgi:hypothetical protein